MWQNAGSIKNCLEIIGFEVFVALVTECITLFLGCSSKRFSYLDVQTWGGLSPGFFCLLLRWIRSSGNVSMASAIILTEALLI